jgi:hypothetical protein
MRLLVHVYWRHDNEANTCMLLQHVRAAKGNDSMLEAMSLECCQLMIMRLKLDSRLVLAVQDLLQEASPSCLSLEVFIIIISKHD